MEQLETSVRPWPADGLPATPAGRTRRVYDLVSGVYPLSTMLFHSRAHRRAVECADIRDGMRVLEVATGSGEMFRRLVHANPGGATVGVDLSPRMAARTQDRARREFPASSAHCQAVDARRMPFRDGAFDAVVCCYLLELLSADDIVRTLGEFRRVLAESGRLALIMIGQNTAGFNRMYKVAGRIAPAFWGRQVERGMAEVIRAADFRILTDEAVQQWFYPSRVLVARK
ncbi:MAG: class I SAM-dependent methyltransferase [Bryobacteraceae bacterium]